MNYNFNEKTSHPFYDMGETFFLEEPSELHIFSDEYQQRKKQILSDSKKTSFRPLLNIAAILIGIFCLIPVSVLGAKFIKNYLIIHNDSGKYQDEFTFEKNSDANNLPSVIHVKVIADFPKEYVRTYGSKQLFWETTDNKSISMTLYRTQEYNKITLQNVISQKELTVNGYDAIYSKLNTAGSLNSLYTYDKSMLIFFEDKGHALEIMGNTTVNEDDFLILAEKVTLEETTYDLADSAVSIMNSGTNSESASSDNPTGNLTEIVSEEMSVQAITQYFNIKFYDYANTQNNIPSQITLPVKVINAHIAKNMDELGHGTWLGHLPKEELVNEDGTFIDYTRQLIKSGDGINTLTEVLKTETISQKIAVVTLEFNNNTNSDVALGLNGYMKLDSLIASEPADTHYTYVENPANFYPLWMDTIKRETIPVGENTGYMNKLYIPAHSTKVLNVVFPLDADRMHDVFFSIDDIVIPIDDKCWSN